MTFFKGLKTMPDGELMNLRLKEIIMFKMFFGVLIAVILSGCIGDHDSNGKDFKIQDGIYMG